MTKRQGWFFIGFVVFMWAIFFASISHAQEHSNTQYVRAYDTGYNSVADMTAAAQSACLPNTSVPCVIVFDAVLATYRTGAMPSKCAQCVWLDYRTTSPFALGSGIFSSANAWTNSNTFAQGVQIGATNPTLLALPSGGTSVDVRPSLANTRGEVRAIPNGSGDNVGGEFTVLANDTTTSGGNNAWNAWYYDKTNAMYKFQANQSGTGTLKPFCFDIMGGANHLCLMTNGYMRWGQGYDNAQISGIGAGMQVITATVTGATAASIGATFDQDVSFTTSFADAVYSPICSGDGVNTGVPVIGGVVAKLTNKVTVRTVALTAAAARFTNISCIIIRHTN